MSPVVVPQDAHRSSALHPVRPARFRRQLPGLPAAAGHRDEARHAALQGRTRLTLPGASLRRPATIRTAGTRNYSRAKASSIFNLNWNNNKHRS
jgi:hypothetical protein